ncbi:MAG: tRNA (N6-isopentenyl adenosine(37)-C2)-methylthiotransferase MiaB [Acidobacteria bacterium]|nr:tRNA (N6-isopentenyl adenosine(37)-C2)-methylthiotransferase MiaB [Acidobacteriota bacterium]
MPRRYLIETFGCQMNVHDSERMAGLLESAGYELASDISDADVVILNTCSVREKAEDKVVSRLGEIRSESEQLGRDPLVAVAGCLAQQEGSAFFKRSPYVDVVVGTQAEKRLPLLVTQAFDTSRRQIDIHPYDDVSFPLGIARRSDPVKAYVTAIEGCNDFCAFCVVPYTRGHERMRPKADILAEVEQVVASGRREVQLLGQIVNHYQAPDDPACDFAGLLEAVNNVAGVERIRFASPHPRHVTSRLIEAIATLPKVCKHLHLPVQSGSSRILAAMCRRHTREDYLDLVGALRSAVPEIRLSTDIIVGFPGETESDHGETLSLVDRVRFDSIFSFSYSERPGTLAAKRLRDDIPGEVKSRRLGELQKRQQEIQQSIHDGLVGRTFDVLVDSVSRRRDTEVSGRTTGNTVVNFPGTADQVGCTAAVLIERAGPHSLWGRALRSTA